MSDMTMTVIRREATGTPVVSAEELAQWITYGPAPMILDVREERFFRSTHVPEAVNAPVSRAAELVRQIPDDGLVVLVCDDGILSREVAKMLGYCGFRQVTCLEGGLRGWMAQGNEVVIGE